MATLTLTNIEERLLSSLELRAETLGRSVEDVAREALERGVAGTRLRANRRPTRGAGRRARARGRGRVARGGSGSLPGGARNSRFVKRRGGPSGPWRRSGADL